MNQDRKTEILIAANDSMRRMFPDRHCNLVTFDEVEQVYSRNVLGINADTKTKRGSARAI